MYPVIICHGFLGYRNMLLWSMFGGADDALHKSGIPALRTIAHPTASIETRANEINNQIMEAYGEDQPVHIIAHSMGGLDARYIASPAGLNQGHRICSITTLSTPHHGSNLANTIPFVMRYAFMAGAWVIKIFLVPGESKDLFSKVADNDWEGYLQLSSTYLQYQFNSKIIDHPNVKYVSYGAAINPFNQTWTGKCRKFVSSTILKNDGINDGMVGIESAAWGECRGTIFANHGEIVGLKVIPWQQSCFDHIAFILEVVKTLPKFENQSK
jgi:triacylglycerol lipase